MADRAERNRAKAKRRALRGWKRKPRSNWRRIEMRGPRAWVRQHVKCWHRDVAKGVQREPLDEALARWRHIYGLPEAWLPCPAPTRSRPAPTRSPGCCWG